MTTYAEVNGTTLIKYPYTFADLQSENPSTNYNGNFDFVSIYPGTDTAKKTGNTLAAVTIGTPPTFDPTSQALVQNTVPTLVNGVWTLGGTLRRLTTAELTALATNAYNAAIAAGIQITSTSTSSLNGTYAIGPNNQTAISAVMTGIANGLGLPGSGSTFYYLDTSGTPHSFTADQFKAFATAVRDYLYALDLFAAGHGSQPSASVTIP